MNIQTASDMLMGTLQEQVTKQNATSLETGKKTGRAIRSLQPKDCAVGELRDGAK